MPGAHGADNGPGETTASPGTATLTSRPLPVPGYRGAPRHQPHGSSSAGPRTSRPHQSPSPNPARSAVRGVEPGQHRLAACAHVFAHDALGAVAILGDDQLHHAVVLPV